MKAIMPLQYFERNHIISKNDLKKRVWEVGYRLPGFVYEFLSDDEKKMQLKKLTKLFWDINLPFQLRSVPATSNTEEHFTRLKQKIRGPLRDRALMHYEHIKDILDVTFEEENDYELYLFVKMKNIKILYRTLKEFALRLVQDPKRFLDEFMGNATPEIYLRELKLYSDAEELFFSKISSITPGITRMSEYEIQRLIRQPFWRGIAEPPIRKSNNNPFNGNNYWKPYAEKVILGNEEAIRPFRRDILTLTEGEVDLTPRRHIEVSQMYKGKERTSLQTFLVVSHIPDLSFPNNAEWFYAPQDRCNFPVEISVRCNPRPYMESLKLIREQKKNVNDQREHNTEANEEIPIDLDEKAENLREFEADIKNQRYPLLETTIIYCIVAPNVKELNIRVEEVKKILDSYGINVERPAHDQWKLFNEVIVGGQRYVNDYVLRLPPYIIAGGMPGATNKLGDSQGFYIGVTGENPKPVYFAPWLISLLNKSPSITWSGSSGYGKSYLFNNCIVNAVLCGAKIILVDPKNERGHWPEKLPELEGQIRVTTLSGAEEDKGKLDPYNLFVHNMETPLGISREELEKMRNEAVKLANNYAITILTFLIGADRKDPRSRMLMKAVTRTGKRENCSMNLVIETLFDMADEYKEDPDRRNMCIDIAEQLQTYREMALAQLFFGDGKEQSLDSNVALNIIQVEGMELPEEGVSPEEYTHEHVISLACLLAIVAFAKKFAMGPRHILKIFALDEAHMVTQSPQGKRLIRSHVKMGRSLNSPAWIVSQNVDDFSDEKVKNNIAVKFAFCCPDSTEATKVLEYFNLRVNAQNIEVLQNLPNGTCIMQDVYGRSGFLTTDVPLERWQECFNTTPNRKEE